MLKLSQLEADKLGVWFWCETCCHNTARPAGELIARVGDVTLDVLARAMVCSRCGSKDICARPDWPKIGQVTRHFTREQEARLYGFTLPEDERRHADPSDDETETSSNDRQGCGPGAAPGGAIESQSAPTKSPGARAQGHGDASAGEPAEPHPGKPRGRRQPRNVCRPPRLG